MKKVLVLAAAVALFATPAFAGIANTKHNLSSLSSNSVKGTSDEICVYCHTPHGAAAAGFAPLWNRAVTTAYKFYNRTGQIQAAVSLAQTNNSDAPLCLSCHDGTTLAKGLNNPPNGGGTEPAAAITNSGAFQAALGTDLSNDHPVGFVFSTALADTEIQTPSGTSVKVNYGGGANEMWCSSCHDVHTSAQTVFLVTSNAGSALCLKCHVK